MRKDKFIELVIKSIRPDTVTAEAKGKYHPKVFELFISTVYNRILYEAQKTGDQFALDSYIISPPAELTVSKDTAKNAYYVDLLVPLVQLSRNEGLREVHPIKDPTAAFAIMANISHATMHHTEVFDIDSTGQAKVEGNRIWLYHPNMSDYETILVKQIVSFDNINQDQDVPMPAGTEELIITSVKQMVAQYPQSLEDTVQDNVAHG